MNAPLVTDLFQRPREASKAISMIILSGNLFGLLAPIITGYVVAGLKSYDWASGIAGILLLIGATSLGAMARQPILAQPRLPPHRCRQPAEAEERFSPFLHYGG